MPIYEYLCKRCGEQFEVTQSITDRPLRKHRGCGGELRKVFYPAGIVFKGSGFYSTDSRKEKAPAGGKKAAKKEEATSKDDE